MMLLGAIVVLIVGLCVGGLILLGNGMSDVSYYYPGSQLSYAPFFILCALSGVMFGCWFFNVK